MPQSTSLLLSCFGDLSSIPDDTTTGGLDAVLAAADTRRQPRVRTRRIPAPGNRTEGSVAPISIAASKLDAPGDDGCECAGCHGSVTTGAIEAKCLALDVSLERSHATLRQLDRVRDLFTRIILRGEPIETLRAAAAELIGRDVHIAEGAVAGTPSHQAFPIEAADRLLGVVRVRVDQGPLSEEQAAIARQAAVAAAMHLLADGSPRWPDGRQSSPHLSVGSGGGDWVPGWLGRLSLDDKRAYLTIALVIECDEPDADQDATLAVMINAVERALQGRRMVAFVGARHDEVVLVVPLAPGRVASVGRILVDHVNSLIRLAGTRYHVNTGLTTVAEEASTVAQRVGEARMAARLGRVLQGPETITAFRDLRAFPAIIDAIASSADNRFRELHERYLGSLVRYEARTGLPLIQTLEVLFDENGNVSGAARSLGINRQSLLYRLRRIEKMCDADLTDPADRFAIELAVRSWAVRRTLFPAPGEKAVPERHPSRAAGLAAPAPRSAPRVRIAAG